MPVNVEARGLQFNKKRKVTHTDTHTQYAHTDECACTSTCEHTHTNLNVLQPTMRLLLVRREVQLHRQKVVLSTSHDDQGAKTL